MATALKAARHVQGWTKPELIDRLREAGAQAGARLAQPQSLRVMLAGWENGYRHPAPPYQRLLCQVYDRSPAQLGFTTQGAGTGAGGLGEPGAEVVAALLYVAPLDTPALALVLPSQARFYAACVLTDPHCPESGELASGYRVTRVDPPPWLDQVRVEVAGAVAHVAARHGSDWGPGPVPSWLRAPRLHGCGTAAQVFTTTTSTSPDRPVNKIAGVAPGPLHVAAALAAQGARDLPCSSVAVPGPHPHHGGREAPTAPSSAATATAFPTGTTLASVPCPPEPGAWLVQALPGLTAAARSAPPQRARAAVDARTAVPASEGRAA